MEQVSACVPTLVIIEDTLGGVSVRVRQRERGPPHRDSGERFKAKVDMMHKRSARVSPVAMFGQVDDGVARCARAGVSRSLSSSL